jgi:NAD(P)-dependent dehydrogenase (short-subunit alcohol dehydrogenase family)
VELEGKVVAVTGGASGIGQALVEAFAARGNPVAVLDLSSAGAARVAASVSGPAMAWGVDMANEHAVAAALDAVEAELGPIGIFCSNAGIGLNGGCELPTEEWQRIWDINLMAHVHVGRVLIPRWLERGGGHLMITASAAGLLTQLGSAPYSVTKAAAVSLAEWVTITYGDQGVTASALCPQGVRTAMTAGLEDSVVGVDGWLEPAEVAAYVLDALARDEFMLLPHPQVSDYVRFKADDHNRWVKGMRRLQARFPDGNI